MNRIVSLLAPTIRDKSSCVRSYLALNSFKRVLTQPPYSLLPK
jgi:hypothetical protein